MFVVVGGGGGGGGGCFVFCDYFGDNGDVL